MKVSFPHMGIAWVGVRHLLQELGFEVVKAPPISRRTMEIGTKHSPEFVCLPFKVIIGNYVEAIEQGAEAIFMLGGIGPCRLGYYAEVQRQILEDMQVPARLIVLEPHNFLNELQEGVRSTGRSFPWSKLVSIVRFSLSKVSFLDDFEAELLAVRYREKEAGSCSRLWAKAVSQVDAASTLADLKRLRRELRAEKQALLRPETGRPLRIGLVGEIYMLIENDVNLNIGEKLGNLGVEVHRSMYSSHWVREHLLPDWRMKRHARLVERLAKPYLPQRVGGHGLETIGNTVDYAKRGFDGVIQVLPLTCMPEIVAEAILPTVSRELDIPTMTLSLDEHSGEAGLTTRLEAFVDMLQARKSGRVKEVDQEYEGRTGS